MTKSILAYFKSENDAEAAHAALQGIRTSNIVVDSMPDEDTDRTFIPIFALGSASGGTGTSGSGGMGSGGLPFAGTAIAEEGDEGFFDDSDIRITHMIQADVEEEDYEKAMDILKENDGYTDKEINE